MGSGAYREAVKLEGSLVCAEPLRAPWSGEACVAFIDTVHHVFQERVETTTTEADGRTSRSSHWEQREEQVSRLERRCPFGLRQGDLELAVDPKGAELELETVVDDLEPEAESRSSGSIVLGRSGRAAQPRAAPARTGAASRRADLRGGRSQRCRREPVPGTAGAGGPVPDPTRWRGGAAAQRRAAGKASGPPPPGCWRW